jgi:hypothetical protein
MFSLLLALLAPEMWFGFSMQISVISANNPRENTDPSERKNQHRVRIYDPTKKGFWKLTQHVAVSTFRTMN